jgi:hypothetical protein
MTQKVRILQKCLVTESRFGQSVASWEADPGEIVYIGDVGNGYARQVQPRRKSLADFKGDANAWEQACAVLYERLP